MLKSMGLGRGAFESGLRPPSTGVEQQRDAMSKPALSRGWFARPEFTGLLFHLGLHANPGLPPGLHAAHHIIEG